MGNDTKGISLGALVVGGAAVLLGAALLTGTKPAELLQDIPDKINWFNGDGAEPDKVCLEVTNLPAQLVTIDWKIGDKAHSLEGYIGNWERCSPASPGDTYRLLVEKSRAGNSVCAAYLLKHGEMPVPLNSASKGGTDDCRISGVVP